MLYALVLIGIITGVRGNVLQCQDLVPGPDITLSQVDGFIGDPAVKASCEAGHVFDTGQLTRYIACTNSTSENGWVAEWNDTVGTCQKKQCPIITSSLGDHMTAAYYQVVSEYGDMATIECIPGYAFSVNLSAPITSRVTSSVNVICEDDPNSASGFWDITEMCSEIACDTPYDVDEADIIYTSTTIGSQVVYPCHSGYWYLSGIYTVIATCNSSAEWETNMNAGWILGLNVRCSKMDAYVGCLHDGDLGILENVTGSLGTIGCRNYCKSNNYRYAGLHDDECFCGDHLADNFTVLDNDHCGLHCTDYDNSSSIPPYCGGEGNKMSVYSSLAGCYRHLDLPPVGEPIIGDLEVTCSERCRGQNMALAAVNFKTCYCYNTTNVIGTESLKVSCKTSTNPNVTSSEYTMVYDLGKTSVTSTTCEELFELGVRMNGDYYLTDPYRREFCYFKDGTACENGWIGFNGYCYLFGAGSVMNFTEARDFCMSNDADLHSVTTKEEYEFLSQTREAFPDVWVDQTNNKEWWLGLYDSNRTNLFTWIDGNILRYSGFANSQPAGNLNFQCVMENENFRWYTQLCSKSGNVICKRPQGFNECKGLDSVPTSQYTYTNDGMTVTFCLEKCKGKNVSYAIVREFDCWCVNDIPSHTNVSRTECALPCPGDQIQHCGGTTGIYMVLQVSGRVLAKSCEDLQILGIGNDTYLTSPDSTPMHEYCPLPQCPYSWVSIGSHCYKFYPVASNTQAFTTCAESDAYLVTIENMKEMNLLVSTVSNISLYSGEDDWRLGLQGLSADGSVFRWSNGYPLDTSIWNGTFDNTTEGPEVVLLMNSSLWSAQPFSDQAYICERGQDYVGCYNLTDALLGDIELNYTKMSVQQCVEWCRAKGRQFAYISGSYCGCENMLTDEIPGGCTMTCPGQSNQICGDAGLASVYNISDIQVFAETCDDLFQDGIFLSGDYIVNGSLQTCNFIDGTNCSFGWFGFEGNCYQHFFAEGSDVDTVCYDQNATITSLTSLDELNVLEDYLKIIQFDLDDMYMVYTGITNGLHGFNVTLSTDGLLTDVNITADGRVNMEDFYDHGHLVLHRAHGATAEGGVVCKKDKYLLGCFNLPDPNTIPPTIANFPSMELTLCKQTCISLNSDIAMMGLTECYCINDTAGLTQGDPVACDQSCVVMSNQKCGDGTVVWAHFTAQDEVPLAESCQGFYHNGVFLNQTYRLANPDRYETCGFTDTTHCSASWFGKDSKCLKIVPTVASSVAARSKCAKRGGYMFNPVGVEINAFVGEIFTETDLFSNIDKWHTGIYPVFYNVSYVTSRGEIVDNHSSVDVTAPPSSYMYYDSGDGLWYKKNSNKMDYICEMDKDYLDCIAISETESASYTAHSNSLTMCIYWCYGQNYSYSATSGTHCKCYENDVTTFTPNSGLCTTACPGHVTQSCGDSHHGYYTYIRTQTLPLLPTTCSFLYNHGVYLQGNYWLEVNGQNLNVECFSPGVLSYKTTSSAKSVHASSSKSGHGVSKASLSFPLSSAWKPSADVSGTWFSMKVDEWYLVVGILIAGIHTHSERSYIQTYTVEYRNLLTGVMDPFPYNSTDTLWPGCSVSYEYCEAYPTDPVVTKEIIIYPQTWHHSISLQLSIYGIAFSNFNYLDRYMGCFMDADNQFVEVDSEISLDECLEVCRNNSKQLAGIDERDHCFCGEVYRRYGYVDESYCPENVTLGKRLGTDTINALALYRTYMTLGALGDSFCGKSQLLLSYTENYVRNIYVPTTLDCMWTTLMLDEEVIDLRVWDNTGLDDLEYNKLRPLSYPQTEVFLVCFSLKCRRSLINTELRWIPEIRSYNKDTPFILVGCKRGKHCNESLPSLPNGGHATITFPYVNGVYTYGMNVTYVCDTGYEFTDGSSTDVIFCSHDNTWTPLTKSCNIISCPEFNVTNGNVDVGSLEYQGVATVTCNPGFYTENNLGSMSVTCQANKTWTMIPTCDVHNLKKQSKQFSFLSDTVRALNDMYSETDVRSSLDCAVLCTEHYQCIEANYKDDDAASTGGVCRLFSDSAGVGDMSNEAGWHYMIKDIN